MTDNEPTTAAKQITYRGVPVPDDLGEPAHLWRDLNDEEQQSWLAGVDDALAAHAPQIPRPREQMCSRDVPYPYRHDAHLWVQGQETVRCPGAPAEEG